MCVINIVYTIAAKRPKYCHGKGYIAFIRKPNLNHQCHFLITTGYSTRKLAIVPINS